MNHFVEFLKTGRLGSLGEGQTTQEVREWLGEPEQSSSKSWPQLWKYGALQLGFHRTSRDEEPFLVSIALYFRHPDEFPPDALKLGGWFPPVGWGYEEFCRWLDDSGIPVVGGVTAGPEKRLVVGPGVRIVFDADLLDSVQFTSKKEPERNQIWISVPKGVLDAIRSEAKAHGVSASSLCSRWVEERAGALAEPASTTP